MPDRDPQDPRSDRPEPIVFEPAGLEEPAVDSSSEFGEEEGFNIRRGMANASWLVLGNYASFAISFITVIVVARPLGPKGYGLVSAVLAFIGAFSWASLHGFDRVVVRSAVGDEDRLEALVATTSGLKTVAACVALTVALLGAWFLPGLSQQERVGITIVSAILLLSPLINAFSTVFQVFEQMRWMTIVNLARQLVYVGGAACLVLYFGPNPLPVITAFTLSYFVALVITERVARKWVKPRIDFKFRELGWPFIKAGALFTFIGFFAFLYTKVDILMIRAFGDLTEVGLYAVALTLFSRLSTTMELFTIAFFPQIVRRAKSGVLVLADMRKGVLALAGIALATALAVWLVAPWIVPLVLGKAYGGAVAPFRILLAALLIEVPFFPLGLLYQARGMESTLAKVIPLRAVLNVVIDIYVLSNGWGIVGVAVGTLVTTVIYYIALTIVAGRKGLLVRDAAEGPAS
jgi:PST family polysaccharide transporter